MNSLETLTVFFGWCTAINIGVFVLACVFVILMPGPAVRMHSKMFGLDKVDLSRQYFQYLAQYKIAILVLSLIPYIALKIIG